MAAQGTINISGSIAGLIEGTINIAPPQIVNNAAVGTIQQVTLTHGTFVAFTLPTNAKTLLITPPAGNAIGPLALKSVTGDGAGLTLHLTDPTLLSLAAGATLGILNGHASTDVVVTLLWN